MNTTEKTKIISERLNTAFSPSQLDVIDDSDKHIGHAGHGGGGRHFTVVISAPCFKGMSRVESHRKIYAVFDDLIPDEIHALRIKII